MTLLRWNRIQTLFAEASDLPESERPAYLERVCDGDQALCAEVLELLDADSSPHSFLDRSPTVALDPIALPKLFPRDEFHPYLLKRVLGEGGMGVVWLAEREDLRTSVAIKILRDGWLSPARLDRFAAEQRTLAQLNHPSIARIYDAKTLSDGTPWFAMEYVEGLPLTEFCARHNTPIDERLQLFRAVCDAVQHAHGQAIIHRDLKPTNILVKNDGNVKLLDFGIAKQLTEDSRDNTRVMTLSYAAPEQVLDGRVGIQSDAYSLGVILYELIAGRHPFDFSRCTITEAESIVMHQQPERPSAAARHHAGSVGGSSLPAGQRLSKAAWKDLDAVCSKAMHKDLQHRYRSVEALTRDLDHYLKREPLEARVPTFRYRLAKFLARNRRSVIASAASFAAVAILVTFLLFRLASARNTALAEATETSRIEGFMFNLFDGGDKEAGPATDWRVLTFLARGVREARTLNAEPEVQAELYQTLGGVYQNLGQFDQADKLLTAALQQRRSLYGADHQKVGDSLAALSSLRAHQNRFAEAERLAQQALAIHSSHLPSSYFAAARDLTLLGQAIDLRGDYKHALLVLRRALEKQSVPGTPLADKAETFNILGDVQYQLGDLASSVASNQQAEALDVQLHGEIHPRVGEDLNNLAIVQQFQGHHAEADPLFRRAVFVTQSWYGENNPNLALIKANFAQNLIEQGKYEEAYNLLNSASAAYRKFYPATDPKFAFILSVLARLSLKRGDFDDAEAQFKRVLEIYRSVYGESYYRVGITIGNLADVDVQRKRYAHAELLYRDALNQVQQALGPDHMQVGGVEVRLGDTLLREGKLSDAKPYLLRGYQVLLKSGGDPAGWTKLAQSDLTMLHATPK